jgi:hypothetical protein
VARAELVLEFKDKVTAGLRNVEGQLQSLSRTAEAIKFASFVTAAQAVLQVSQQIANSLKDYINAGMEAIKADTQFEYTLRSLTGATREQIKATEDYIETLSKKVGVDDDELKRLTALAFSMGVQGSQMEDLIKVSQSLAMAYGIDLQDAMLKVIKAGEGHTEGLRRMGIYLDENRVQTEGLSYVLSDLGRKYNFVNEYMETGAGKYENLKNIMEEVKEEIGKTILNSEGFKFAVEQISNAIESASPVLNFFAWLFSHLGYVIGVASRVAKAFFDGLTMIGMAIKTVASAIWNLITKDFKSAVEELNKGWAEIEKYALSSIGAIEKTDDALKNLNSTIKETKGLLGEIARLRTAIQQIEIEAYYIAQRNIPVLRVAVDYTKEMDSLFKGIDKSLENSDKYLKNMTSKELEKMEHQVQRIANAMFDFVDKIWEGVRAGRDLVDVLKEAVEELLIAVVKAIVFQLIYNAVATAMGMPSQPFNLSNVLFGAYQEGGVVDRPTLALVGEKEREYIIPESKFPQPVVYVQVHNANPDTYATVFVKMSKRARKLVYSKLMEA